MSYLQFDKTLMTNLEEALKKEVLRSNRSGAYSCSTILDCNTRKYHGLLVVPIPEIDDENQLVTTKNKGGDTSLIMKMNCHHFYHTPPR